MSGPRTVAEWRARYDGYDVASMQRIARHHIPYLTEVAELPPINVDVIRSEFARTIALLATILDHLDDGEVSTR